MTVFINSYLCFSINDPHRAYFGCQNIRETLQNVAQGELKNLVQSYKLSELIQESKKINEEFKLRVGRNMQKGGVTVLDADIT